MGLVAAGCGATPAAEVRIDPSKKAAAASNEGEGLASIVVVDRPTALAIDGDLGEWGNIVPPPPKDPPAPASHIAIAFGTDGVSMAGMLGAGAADGLYFALRLGQPPLLPIGSMARWGAVQELNCETEPDGSPRPPEEVSSCEAVVAAREGFGEGQLARFQRVYKLDRKGLRFVDDGGALVDVPGAKVVFKDSKAGVTMMEVAFPQKALPRTTQAPLGSIGASARGGSGDKAPPGILDDIAAYDLPSPVGFQPYAALREAAFGAAMSRSAAGLNLSYQPGDALELEDVVYPGGDTTAVASVPKKLFDRQITWNGFEVGYVYASGNAVAALTKTGELGSMTEIVGEPRGFVERDGELHIFSYELRDSPEDGSTHAMWSAVALEKDGSIRVGLVESGMATRWLAPIEFANEDFSRFGIMGAPGGDMSGAPLSQVEAVWTWNSKEKAYGLEMIDEEPTPPATGKNKAPPPKSKPSAKKKK